MSVTTLANLPDSVEAPIVSKAKLQEATYVFDREAAITELRRLITRAAEIGSSSLRRSNKHSRLIAA
ncbi:MAG TPA: hypothetical protein V6C97_19920 [Oculatellaceae cyanobacterium]